MIYHMFLSFTRHETGQVIEKEVSARTLFEKLVEMNWRTAEPGILFWDNISNWNLLSETEGFSYAGTNPCAEEAITRQVGVAYSHLSI